MQRKPGCYAPVAESEFDLDFLDSAAALRTADGHWPEFPLFSFAGFKNVDMKTISAVNALKSRFSHFDLIIAGDPQTQPRSTQPLLGD